MAMGTGPVAVFGATGETGRRVVRTLQGRGIGVRAVVRDRDRAAGIMPGVEVAVADVGDRAAVDRAIAGCSAVICATGAKPSLDVTGPLRVDYLGTRNLVDAMKGAGIDRLVLVSSMCVSNFFHPLNLFWLVLFWKQQAEAYIRESGLTYTIVRPGGLKNEDAPTPVVMASADSLFEGSIPRSQVAAVCVEALECSAAYGKTVEVVARPDAPDRAIAEWFAQTA
jgi:uncharacterized protein YbjT (DUF2867 family)